MKTGIIIVSFGCMDKLVREKSTLKLREDVKNAFPDAEVLDLYLNGRVREETKTPSVEEALKSFANEGFERVILQPAYLMAGGEYENLKRKASEHEKSFKYIKVGEPLTTKNSCEKLAKALCSIVDKDKVTVLAGHGSIHEANDVYVKLQKEMKEMGFEKLVIGTFEAEPGIDYVLTSLKKLKAKEVTLMPLLSVAGNHAVKDIFGEKNSYLDDLRKAGYEVFCVKKGLCEFPEIRKLWVDSIKKKM